MGLNTDKRVEAIRAKIFADMSKRRSSRIFDLRFPNDCFREADSLKKLIRPFLLF
jgi:hypothetical protein